MAISPAPAIQNSPAVVFQLSGNRLELLNKEGPVYPGLTATKLSKILRGEWRNLVPAEFHPVVEKLGRLTKSETYTTVEFPVFWMGSSLWLRVLAASSSPQKHRRKIIGLAQDVTSQRLCTAATELPADPGNEEENPRWRKLRHDINGSLTSVVMNCELLLETDCSAAMRRKIENILSEALQIDQLLRHYSE